MTHDHDLEQALLRRAQAGDTQAYTDLHLRLEPLIRRYVRRMIQHPETEDDIVQDVFIAFYCHLSQIEPADSLRPYLFRIARNRCYDDLRRVERGHEALSLDEEPVEITVSFTRAHSQPRPDDLAHWMLLHLEVREAIDRLPEVQRQVLLLFSEENLSYAEMADLLGVSAGTVKSRLFYARKNLCGLLRPATLAVLQEEFSPAPSLPQPATTVAAPA
ncbi:MAG: sigma-70 family RNA polymerase sigma factor [Anaerolineae bacterium]|nr:sigma-70 family RNA polymerase sigma factor [Anaerolineae bacterium]